MAERICCTQCGREKAEKEFFMMKTHERYPVCKTCLTMYIDNSDPSTFKWILEKFDVPYIERDWKEEAQNAYDKNPANFSGASVIGRYLRRMNMTQYRNLTYADSARLAAEEEKRQQEAAARVSLASEDEQEEFMNLQAKLDAGEISQAEFDTLNPLMRGVERQQSRKYTFDQEQIGINEDDILAELTEEDKKMLATKWGIVYKPSEWVHMEETYTKYANEYELNVDRELTLKQICKLELKMDQALDVGDTGAYKSLQQSYDALRKSSKFTEVQNKEGQTRYLDSIGELVQFCEREGGLIDQLPDPDEYPEDKIDFTIKDMKAYIRNLVTNELGLGDLIESYVKKLEDAEREKEKSLDAGLYTSIEEELADQVTPQEEIEFQEYLDNEVEEEAARLLEMLGGDV